MASTGDPVESASYGARLGWLQAPGAAAKPWQAWCKRSGDLVTTVLLLPVLLPVLGVMALLVKLDSKGPALYLDKRLGLNGNQFTCYKFRTMYLDSDRILAAHLAQHPDAQNEWRRFRKLRGEDPRVTRLGRILRKLSLDELPQIFNVMAGHMSLVGPRPYLVNERDLMGASRSAILQVRPGITGLWQVTGRNEIPFEDRIRIESWYALNWSLQMDLAILVRTVGVVLKGRGAF